MVQYTCPRCNYSTKQRRDLRKHLHRKRPCTITNRPLTIAQCALEVLGEENLDAFRCVGGALKCVGNAFKCVEMRSDALKSVGKVLTPQIVDFSCDFCDKTFKEARYLNQHIKRYQCGKRFFTLEEVEKRIAEKCAEKDNMINSLNNQIGKLLEKVGDTYNTNTYNIVINPFGKENTSYISEDFVRSLIDDGPYNSIPKLLKYIHFHPEHKENHNIKIPNKKQPYAQVYNGKDWEYQLKKDTIEAMSDRAFTILNKHFRGDNEYMSTFQTNYNDNTPDLAKRLRKDIEVTILNNQGSILNTTENPLHTQGTIQPNTDQPNIPYTIQHSVRGSVQSTILNN